MFNMKKIYLLLLLFSIICGAFIQKASADVIWNNNLHDLLLSNNAVIYTINIRSFNAKDANCDGIIDETEERGNFLNAIDRLDELSASGVNVIRLLPITPVGKVKALGTAGSLFAPSSFNDINPQLKAKNSNLSLEAEMQKFVSECHKRNIGVIVDLPCCGSYDLYLQHPELFKKDADLNPIVPADWTDVRLLDAGTNTQINMDVYNLYASFIDFVTNEGFDGIVADVASSKTSSFWKNLISETKGRNPQFLFLAEASPYDKSISQYAEFTTLDKLLDAGFDGCYSGYTDFKNWQTANELFSAVNKTIKLQKKYLGTKSFVSDLNTHNQISPILINGPQLSDMILWLNATLPINAHYVDGFSAGDDYIYFWTNKKARKTYTDDDYYFTHRGQLDIFNFSRRPQGKYVDLFKDFILSNRVKIATRDILSNGNFVQLRTNSPNVFSYARSANSQTIVVIGNLNFKNMQNVNISVPRLSKNVLSVPIKIKSIPTLSNGKISTTLSPGEVQVLMFNSFDIK